MIKQIIFVLCVLFSTSCLGQFIAGVVKDSLNNSVGLAMVSLFKNDSVIAHMSTNNTGVFNFTVSETNFPLDLVVSKFGYTTINKHINAASTDLQITLYKSSKVLDELIIKAPQPDVLVRNDSLFFNLEKLLNGSEIKLKNIIEKLPGLSIDTNGKIKYNGALLDHLLVDGDKFFGKNHQLATENLTSDMIADIELLKNFKDLSDFESTNLSKTALNIKLKDRFKLLLKGNLEAETGLVNRYKFHNHLYKFGASNKFSLILNSNNLNYSVISIQDFIDQKNNTGENVFKDSNGKKIVRSSVEDNLPPFLFASDLVKGRTLNNATLNFTRKISTTKRFEFVSIANGIRQKDFSEYVMQFFDNSTATSINGDKATTKGKFWTNFLEYENRLSATTYQKFKSYLLVNRDSENQNLLNSIPDLSSNTIFNTRHKINSTQIGANILYKNQVKNNVLLDAIFFTDYKTSSTAKNMFSSSGFTWFDYLDDQINQKTNIDAFNLGGKTSADLILNDWEMNFKLQSTLFYEQLTNYNELEQSYNFNSDFLKAKNLISGMATRNFFNSKLKLQFLLDIQNESYQVKNKFNKTVFAVLPALAFKYRFSNTLILSSQYGLESDSFNPGQFLLGSILKDYRTVLLQNSLTPSFIPKYKSTINLVYSDFYKNLLISLSYSHNEQNKVLSEVSNNFNFYSSLSYDYVGRRKSDFIFLTASKKWQNFPLGIEGYANYSRTESNLVVNSSSILNITTDFYSTLEFRSYFKSSTFNFKGAMQYSTTQTKNLDSQHFKSSLQQFTPLINFFGTLYNKKMNWDVSYKYPIYKSSILSDGQVLDLGFSLSYNLTPKFNLFINGANVLNISDQVFKNQVRAMPYFVQQLRTNILPGSVTIGLKYVY